jgi:hypothetical protein
LYNKEYKRYIDRRFQIEKDYPPNKVEDYVISYTNFTVKDTLLSKMGRQYNTKHYVKWNDSARDSYWGHLKLDMEIRVLNYDFVRN